MRGRFIAALGALYMILCGFHTLALNSSMGTRHLMLRELWARSQLPRREQSKSTVEWLVLYIP